MTRRGWLLFAAMSVIWGIPYLLIKVSVRELSPPVLVFARTGLASLVLIPLAARQGYLAPLRKLWKPLLAFTAIEMAGPWLLLTHAEESLPSGLTGLLVATVPLFGTTVAFLLGDRAALRPIRLAGLAIGLIGVGLLIALGEGLSGGGSWVSIVEVILVAVGYASAPFIADRYLSEVPALGVVAASLGIVAVVFLPFAIAFRPDSWPSAPVVQSTVALAAVCTGLAFIIFFKLIAEVGPARSTLITFLNPAVAVALGITFLSEDLTLGIIVGFPCILAGCWLATRSPGDTDADADAEQCEPIPVIEPS